MAKHIALSDFQKAVIEDALMIAMSAAMLFLMR